MEHMLVFWKGYSTVLSVRHFGKGMKINLEKGYENESSIF
jgi:hypothetical protein